MIGEKRLKKLIVELRSWVYGKGYMGKGYMGKGYMGKGYMGKGYMGKGYRGKGYMGKGYMGKGKGYMRKGYMGKGWQREGVYGNGVVYRAGVLLLCPCRDVLHDMLIQPHSPWAMKALKVSHFSNSGPHAGVCRSVHMHAGTCRCTWESVDSMEECRRVQSHVQLCNYQITAWRHI